MRALHADKPVRADKRKRIGMVAKTPAERQAERRARGAVSVTLSGPVLVRLDKLAADAGDLNRVQCLARLIADAEQRFRG